MGGVAGNIPYIQIGSAKERGIERSNLRDQIVWKQIHPLVFINGCHTTALQPSTAYDLVTGFVDTAGAAGVIGTEITIFESLACAFGRDFLRQFLDQGRSVGNAVRGARLTLLKNQNPLGLVYLPFALASLTLKPGIGTQPGSKVVAAVPQSVAT